MDDEERVPFFIGSAPCTVIALRAGQEYEWFFQLPVRLGQIKMGQCVYRLVERNGFGPRARTVLYPCKVLYRTDRCRIFENTG